MLKSRPTVAFVATGGAARGIAHLGVVKACEELGIQPEIFVGTSSGAIVAATYGQGVSLDVLLDAYRLPWKRRHNGPRFHASKFFGTPRLRELFDPGYLFSGVFSIDRLERYLSEHLPNNDFAKAKNRLFVTAVDIDRAERVVFGGGYEAGTPISRAVAASCCVPGLFRPYRIGERFLVDGEIARTLSADLAIEAGADVVIISNVYRPSDASARRSLARRGAFKVLNQTFNIVLCEKERRGLDLYARSNPKVRFVDVAPDIGGFGYLNRFTARSLVMRGYRAALRALAEAKERGFFDTSAFSAGDPLN